MSHAIMENDKGIVGFCEVYGGTWHQVQSYQEINGPVCNEEVERTFNFQLEKEQLKRSSKDKLVDSWAIIRKDVDKVLVPSVGSRFNVISHLNMFDKVKEGLLKKYPDLDIESAGTLKNGATAFVNLKLKDIKVKGDESKNLSRMMFFNPLGQGAYTLGVHNVRIVCNNTMRASEAQAAANNSLKKIRHTASAPDKINDALVDLAEVRMGLDVLEQNLNTLTTYNVDTNKMTTFLDWFLPVDDVTKSAATRREQKRDRIVAEFEEADGLENNVSRSLYSLLQAVTYVEDHPETLSKNQDQTSIMWDGMVGSRAKRKEDVMDYLLATV